MARFGLFGNNKDQSIQEFDGESIMYSLNAPELVEIRNGQNKTTAVIRLAEGQCIKEIPGERR